MLKVIQVQRAYYYSATSTLITMIFRVKLTPGNKECLKCVCLTWVMCVFSGSVNLPVTDFKSSKSVLVRYNGYGCKHDFNCSALKTLVL